MLDPLRVAYLNLWGKYLKNPPQLCNLNTLLFFYKKA